MNATEPAENSGPRGGTTRTGAGPIRMDAGTPALVLRLDDNLFHHGTLAAVRSLGRAGVEVHAVLEGPHAPAARSRHLTRMYRWPDGPRTPEALVAALESIAARIGRRALLIPMDDAGAIFTAEHAAALRPSFLLPDQVPELPRRLADKAALAELCASLDIAQPETRVIRSEADAAAAASGLGLPLMAKWAKPWLLPPGSGLRSTAPVRTPQAAARIFAQAAGHGSELLFQRFVPGAPGSDWFFQGYFGAGSSCLLGGAGRKERAYPPRAGLTTLGRWLPNPRVEAAAHRIAAALGYRGVLDLDFRHDAAADVYYLLDFNPRLGAQFRLFTDDGGLDLVRALHLDLTGGAVPEGRPAYGRTYLVENYDAFPAFHDRRTGELTYAGWLRSVREADEFAWFSAEDFKPFVAMTRQTLKRGFTRIARRHRNSPAGSR
ncbi:ATP-grasp domain-containing protein [Planomonospora venezuelensis]|uniref:Putative ATP-grasp superfamily ATP-dependent carboligase n=1 Tax=Planomonospora venezuelensis TaxID=1999 RepID=A0A841CUI0_PLAVE|nr:ATP-grasp domain-containing protein [Planomonospora venezuelensis]MBB5962062.1 putative ATP-grasp superfamily ATP-dependent carboligase [Planomonospora venezuelensis]GIN00163.1 ATP-grasp domain-containing protein [Planomonospora venezuelensis]